MYCGVIITAFDVDIIFRKPKLRRFEETEIFKAALKLIEHWFSLQITNNRYTLNRTVTQRSIKSSGLERWDIDGSQHITAVVRYATVFLMFGIFLKITVNQSIRFCLLVWNCFDKQKVILLTSTAELDFAGEGSESSFENCFQSISATSSHNKKMLTL